MDDLAYGVIFILVVLVFLCLSRTSENRPQGGGTKCITRSTPATPKAPPPPPRHRDKKPITPVTPPPPRPRGEAIGMKAPRWISVTDRLPEEDGDYLVYAFGFVDRLRFADGVWWDYGAECQPGVVTHWMPLPEPPEGVGGDE